jgi:hypothetical protein
VVEALFKNYQAVSWIQFHAPYARHSVHYNVRMSKIYPRSNNSVFLKDSRVCVVHLANTPQQREGNLPNPFPCLFILMLSVMTRSYMDGHMVLVTVVDHCNTHIPHTSSCGRHWDKPTQFTVCGNKQFYSDPTSGMCSSLQKHYNCCVFLSLENSGAWMLQ